MLTRDEVVDLTGSKQYKGQGEVLSKNGIYYIVRKDKSIRVTVYAVHHPNTLETKLTNEPDYESLEAV